ncbi:MAG: hypothetical protein IKK93_03790 [Campylobacter sp.]|nr:hypothetical protein [Campylobacter sp.]MBR2158501.1 hypothetical protein [Campylobacter sp.]MBR2221582.1 hypothetical protein [Campylobacter sp.]MBR6611344.1 hypothetical protein [Campylobacter sp.]
MKKGLLTKASIGAFGLMSMASLANAAITVDPSNGNITGNVDLDIVFAAFGVILTAIATIWGLKRVIRMFSGA